MSKEHPRVFISYSWTSEEYQHRVVELANRLVGDGVDVAIDVWDLKLGHDEYAFMERCVTDDTIDKVLILCDKKYAQKANAHRGGVGTETAVITPEVYGSVQQEKYIPVVMERGKKSEGDEKGEVFLPVYLRSRKYVDLSVDTSGQQYEELLRCIYDKPKHARPKIGQYPSWLDSKGASQITSAPKAPAKKAEKSLPDYSWAELKSIADEIAEARDYDSAMRIAHSYGLVDDEFRLKGDTKLVLLDDDTNLDLLDRQALVRIAGFRHDDSAVVNGKAGITFEFANVPADQRMNPKRGNSGGWEESEMRRWLNSNFLSLLPNELRSGMARVRKRTNNRGGDVEGDASVVTVTEDKLWLPSMSEVFGSIPRWLKNHPYYPDVYDAEGRQYQVYADQGVSATYHAFCSKDGTRSVWWLRSPDAGGEDAFRYVGSDGGWRYGNAGRPRGVSPCFCF